MIQYYCIKISSANKNKLSVDAIKCDKRPELQFICDLLKGNNPKDQGYLELLPARRLGIHGPIAVSIYVNEYGRLYNYQPTMQTVNGEWLVGNIAIFAVEQTEEGDLVECGMTLDYAQLLMLGLIIAK